jgi:hypothetical protein
VRNESWGDDPNLFSPAAALGLRVQAPKTAPAPSLADGPLWSLKTSSRREVGFLPSILRPSPSSPTVSPSSRSHVERRSRGVGETHDMMLARFQQEILGDQIPN